MNSHERILATLHRQPVDRTPVDVWLTPEVLASLKSHVGESDELSLYQTLGIDKIVWVFPEYRSKERTSEDEEGLGPWGVPRHKVTAGSATYFEPGQGPLANLEDPEELQTYPFWPDPDGFDYSTAKHQAERARAAGFATIGPWISHFEIYCQLRGMENAFMDVVAEPEFLDAALDHIEQIQTAMLERYLSALGDLLDIVFISDDMGSQNSLLISIPAWQQFLRPRLERWVEIVHRHGKKVLFHTDGAVRDLVPHLIDAGIDILNPIQHVCPGMERAALKRDFGEQVIFHGGVENQQILPFGSVEEVRDEVFACLHTLGRDGGYIPSSCHNIQAGTPPRNVIAMIEAVHAWKP